MKFQRDQTLVVIHAEYRIEFAFNGTVKDGVGRVGAGTVEAHPTCLLDGWRDDLGVLGAEEVVFAGMGVQARDRQARQQNIGGELQCRDQMQANCDILFIADIEG